MLICGMLGNSCKDFMQNMCIAIMRVVHVLIFSTFQHNFSNFLFLFSNKMLIIRAGIYKILVYFKLYVFLFACLI